MKGLTFKSCSLVDSKIFLCEITNTSFSHCNLTNLTASGTDFNQSTFHESLLLNADLEDCDNISKEQIEGAIIDHKTKLPAYLMDVPDWYNTQL
jgi:uncharacterized protein YjbI with pentapeptide repeats